VSAEFAVVVPAVVLLLALCLSAMQLSTRQVRVQDAAAVAARLAARGEPGGAPGAVSALVPGARLALDDRGEVLCATVSAPGPPGPFAGIAAVASSCAPAAGGVSDEATA